MSSDDENAGFGRLRRVSAFGVHLLTVSGAAFALLALLAAIDKRWTLMFAWLGCALAVDGVDGTIARRLEVRRALPRWSGDVLDLVVDVLTYVFVPAYAIAAGGLLPDRAAVLAGLLVVCTGALYFADLRMKTADNYFVGFPASWNVVAFYLFVVRPDPWLALAVVVGLCALTFLPIPFVHPLRVARLRALNVVLLVAWSALAGATLASGLGPPVWVVVLLCVIGVYFLFAGFLRGRNGAEP
ncbi:MAG: phosphatidylcholine synthase [Variibacter sp.]|nr:phosphatidylcholine synthase [Variibacter sp.]